MEEKIIEILKSKKITEFGFCKIKYYKELEEILLLQENLDRKTSFQVGNIDRKVFKDNYFKDYKSALVILVPYTSGKEEKKTITENDIYLSTCSWDNDYHIVLNNILIEVKEELEKNGYKAIINVDNNSLDERYLAYQAGTGYYGKNNLLFNDKYGSYFFIGVLLTDAVFKYNKPLKKKCLECDLCVKNCPVHALDENGILNGKKCLSYLNQKKNVTIEESKYFNNCIYGCDICQDICPLNRIDNKAFFKYSGKEIIKLSNSKKFINDFEKKYKNNSCSWRNKDIFERNINFYVNNNKNKKTDIEKE